MLLGQGSAQHAPGPSIHWDAPSQSGTLCKSTCDPLGQSRSASDHTPRAPIWGTVMGWRKLQVTRPTDSPSGRSKRQARLGWVGSRLAPKAVSHGLCDLTSLPRLGPYLWLYGLTAAQTADDSLTSPRCWQEGDTAVPVCVGRTRLGPWGGGSGHMVRHSGTPLFFSSGLWSPCWRVMQGCVCLVLRAQQRGVGALSQGSCHARTPENWLVTQCSTHCLDTPPP